jgi:lauroyl/myristoyl acyltransferase
MNAVFERWIRAAPEQWAWHQRRWPADEHVERASESEGE